MSQNHENTEMTTTQGYAMVKELDSMMADMADELQGLEFTIDKVKFPSAGSTVFGIPTGDGEDSDMVKEIKGVVIYQHPSYAYYASAFTGGHAAPDCSSIDGKYGHGIPGGNCKTCKYNQYGTGANGKSKACQNKRCLYILREGELFPIMLLLPPGSVKSYSNFVKSQISQGHFPGKYVTRFSLKKAKNDDGIEYSQAVFGFERMLTPEEVSALAPMAETAKAYSQRMAPADFADEDVPFVDAETGEIVTPLT